MSKIKGRWYYEIQVLMLVFMWQHDMSHKPIDPRGFRFGRLHIWYDSAWLDHGFPSQVKNFLVDNTIPIFIKSLCSYLRLYDAGFRISNYKIDDGYERYRFFWKGRFLRETPDIVRVGNTYKTVQNGHVEELK